MFPSRMTYKPPQNISSDGGGGSCGDDDYRSSNISKKASSIKFEAVILTSHHSKVPSPVPSSNPNEKEKFEAVNLTCQRSLVPSPVPSFETKEHFEAAAITNQRSTASSPVTSFDPQTKKRKVNVHFASPLNIGNNNIMMKKHARSLRPATPAQKNNNTNDNSSSSASIYGRLPASNNHHDNFSSICDINSNRSGIFPKNYSFNVSNFSGTRANIFNATVPINSSSNNFSIYGASVVRPAADQLLNSFSDDDGVDLDNHASIFRPAAAFVDPTLNPTMSKLYPKISGDERDGYLPMVLVPQYLLPPNTTMALMTTDASTLQQCYPIPTFKIIDNGHQLETVPYVNHSGVPEKNPISNDISSSSSKSKGDSFTHKHTTSKHVVVPLTDIPTCNFKPIAGADLMDSSSESELSQKAQCRTKCAAKRPPPAVPPPLTINIPRKLPAASPVTCGLACVPLKSPVPSMYQGDLKKGMKAKVPSFSSLVNYPYSPPDEKVQIPDNIRGCVMCGQYCAYSAKNSKKKRSTTVAAVTVDTATAATATPTASEAKKSQKSVQHSLPALEDVKWRTQTSIPPQNKGICTDCDRKVFVVVASGLQIKWCKGCKNFKAWAAFDDKGYMSKCVRCRETQCKNYKKKKDRQKDLADAGKSAI